jgi:PEP-CTERM motif
MQGWRESAFFATKYKKIAILLFLPVVWVTCRYQIMNKRYTQAVLGTLLLGCLSLGTSTTTQAQTTAFTFPTTTGADTTFGSIGLEFEVIDPLGITLTDYGAYDSSQDGFANPVTIQIYSINALTDTSGTTVGVALPITSGATLDGTSRFVPLSSSLILTPGKYVISMVSNGELYANDPSGNGVILNSGAALAPQVVTLGIGTYRSRFGFGVFPDFRNNVYDKAGPTFKYTANTVATPEPTTLALFGLGATAFIVRRRKK